MPPSDDLHGTVASLSGGPTITSLWSELTELLRDVGPTLVATILLDGPQLGSRWTARCASVLADDPGSAVLTADGDARVSLARAVLGTALEARRDARSVTSLHG